MGRRLAALRVPARIARRNALRAKGRTALVALMVGLPIAAASTLAVLFTSSVPTDATYLQQALGDHAQARLQVGCSGGGLTVQDVRGEATGCFNSTDELSEDEIEAAIAAALPGDLEVARMDVSEVRLASDTTSMRYNRYGEIDLRRPELAAVVELREGRVPLTLDEILLVRDTARELGVAPGDEVAIRVGRDDPRTVTVSGITDYSMVTPAVLALPGAVPEAVAAGPDEWWSSDQWVVTGESPVTWDRVLALNEVGITATSRAVVLDPPDRSEMPFHTEMPDGAYDSRTMALGAVAVGAGLLEAVLLIGPAFAVGARRSARELALLAANGGERRDLRRVVVWSGLVIGAGASLVAAVLGLALGAGLVLVLNEVFGGFPNLRVPWLMAGGFVLLGVLIAVAAAWFPARQASRVDVVAALSGRRSEANPHHAVPIAGVLLLGVGTVAALAGAARSSMAITVAGVGLITVGMVAASGAIVTLVGRLAPRLPLAPRLALRDAARQRSRTAPAVAAVIAAVAGASAGAVYLAADGQSQKESWTPTTALGVIQAGIPTDYYDDDLVAYADALAQLEEGLEQTVAIGASATVRSIAQSEPTDGSVGWLSIYPDRAPERRCPLWEAAQQPSEAELERFEDDPRCAMGDQSSGRSVWYGGLGHLVDDGSVIGLTGLPGAPEAAAALADGAVLVSDPLDLWPDGTVHLELSLQDEQTGEVVEEQVVLPGHVVGWESHLYDLVLPPGIVDQVTEIPVDVVPVGLIAQPAHDLTDEEVVAVEAVAQDVEDAEVYVEAPYPYSANPSILGVVGAAAVVGLAATWIAVGLAAAESRADLATLAAVGASPRTRRSVAGAQAGVIAGTGVALGVAAGILLGVVFVKLQAAQAPFTGNPAWEVVIPWPALGLVLVGLPSLAVLAAMAVTRSRLPVVRRIAQ